MTGRRIELATMNHHYMFYDLDVFFENASKLGYPCVELWTSPQHFLWITSKTIQRNAF